MTEESLRRKAFMLGMKLKNSGLDPETIYARLEKQGISENLAKKVAFNVQAAQKKEAIQEEKENTNIWFVTAGFSIALCVLSMIIFPNIILIPTGLIISGVLLGIKGLLGKEN